MKIQLLFSFLMIIMMFSGFTCSHNYDYPVGKYTLTVEGLKNIDAGTLEIVGEENDYFGRLHFTGKRERTYPVGLDYLDKDSMHFFMAGTSGYLTLKKQGDTWKGKFKYFGLKADIIATNEGLPSSNLQNLVALKPIAKGVISTNEGERFPTFDAKKNTLYFARGNHIYASLFEKNKWKTPQKVAFSNDYNDGAPKLSHDFNTMIFTSSRPISGKKQKKKNLWQAQKDIQSSSWKNLTPLPFPINIDTLGDYHGMQTQQNDNFTTYYFISYNRKGGFGRSDIYKGTLRKDDKVEVENLGNIINTEKSEADVFVSPDGNVLLFATTDRDDSYGKDDIYVSYFDGKNWSAPKNIGYLINSFAYEYGAWIDFKNGFLYFNSNRRGSADLYRIQLKQTLIDLYKTKKIP